MTEFAIQVGAKDEKKGFPATAKEVLCRFFKAVKREAVPLTVLGATGFGVLKGPEGLALGLLGSTAALVVASSLQGKNSFSSLSKSHYKRDAVIEIASFVAGAVILMHANPFALSQHSVRDFGEAMSGKIPEIQAAMREVASGSKNKVSVYVTRDRKLPWSWKKEPIISCATVEVVERTSEGSCARVEIGYLGMTGRRPVCSVPPGYEDAVNISPPSLRLGGIQYPLSIEHRP
ncbi:MAG: hypothetical protein HGA90_04055 [Alphaproteobacteria bacterium]|nr:hypothetical protein [Alphaproteobacteria bacterium]